MFLVCVSTKSTSIIKGWCLILSLKHTTLKLRTPEKWLSPSSRKVVAQWQNKPPKKIVFCFFANKEIKKKTHPSSYLDAINFDNLVKQVKADQIRDQICWMRFLSTLIAWQIFVFIAFLYPKTSDIEVIEFFCTTHTVSLINSIHWRWLNVACIFSIFVFFIRSVNFFKCKI